MILSAAAVQIAVRVIVTEKCVKAAMLFAVRFFTHRQEKNALSIIAAGSIKDISPAESAVICRVTLFLEHGIRRCLKQSS